jgi:hypothetical protein
MDCPGSPLAVVDKEFVVPPFPVASVSDWVEARGLAELEFDAWPAVAGAEAVES